MKLRDTFRSVDQQSAIDRALRYPYTLPKVSYLFQSGQQLAIDANTDVEYLTRSRTPVFAYGSNAAVEALNRKYCDFRDMYHEGIPVIQCRLKGYAVVFAAQFSTYGALPATIHPHKDHELRTYISYLTDDQLQRMHDTEDLGLYYSFREIQAPIKLDNFGEISSAYAYIGMGGALLVDDHMLAVKGIDQDGSGLKVYSQAEVQKAAMEALGVSAPVETFIAENALNKTLRDRRFKALATSAQIW